MVFRFILRAKSSSLLSTDFLCSSSITLEKQKVKSSWTSFPGILDLSFLQKDYIKLKFLHKVYDALSCWYVVHAFDIGLSVLPVEFQGRSICGAKLRSRALKLVSGCSAKILSWASVSFAEPWPYVSQRFLTRLYSHRARRRFSLRMAFLDSIWVSERFPLRACFLWVGSLLPFWFAHRVGRSSRHTMEGVGQGEVFFWSKSVSILSMTILSVTRLLVTNLFWVFKLLLGQTWNAQLSPEGLSNVPSSPLECFSAARRASYSITVQDVVRKSAQMFLALGIELLSFNRSHCEQERRSGDAALSERYPPFR